MVVGLFRPLTPIPGKHHRSGFFRDDSEVDYSHQFARILVYECLLSGDQRRVSSPSRWATPHRAFWRIQQPGSPRLSDFTEGTGCRYILSAALFHINAAENSVLPNIVDSVCFWVPEMLHSLPVYTLGKSQAFL
jgi:hypothetical protein